MTTSPSDLEKQQSSARATDEAPASPSKLSADPVKPPTLLQRIAQWEDRFGVEGRGIQPVPAAERIQRSASTTLQIVLMWFSANLVANNVLVGFLGPQVFGLSFKDSALLCLFGNLLGCFGPFYISGLGPKSGNRTMVILRFVFGWWPAKLCACLQLIGTLGYGLLAALVTGQILSAVSKDGSMTVAVGVIIAAVIVIVVCVVGMKVFHVYERYALIPSLIVFFIMVGCAGPNFNITSPSVGTPEVIRGSRVSMFFVVFNTAFVWSMCSADYFVYYPEDMPRVLTGSMSYIGIFLGLLFSELMGVGLASGSLTKKEWMDAMNVAPGALMVEAFAPLGGFGMFCAVVLASGPITNAIPGVYSSALAWQLLGDRCAKIPRTFWTIFGILVYTICAIAGRNNIFGIFENFLALMGYWVTQFVAIVFEEEFLFRRKFRWEDWNQPSKLPVGYAALFAFLMGWMGAILSMYQVWWVGPIAKKAFGDVGVPVATGLAVVVYPPLRWLELQFNGR